MITESEYNQALLVVKQYEIEQDKSLHYKIAIDVWFLFYSEKKQFNPTHGARQGKCLKDILKKLKSQAAQKGFIDWSEEYCKKVFIHFLTLAYSDKWLSDNFLLTNLNSKFDKVICSNVNGNTSNKRETASTSDLQTTLTGFAQDYFQQ